MAYVGWESLGLIRYQPETGTFVSITMRTWSST